MQDLIKRLFDIVVAASLLGLLAPVILTVAVVVRLCIGSPILFQQVRPGLHGRPLVVYKFRTMSATKDERGMDLPDAVRLTSLGRDLRKLSLDELPQLFNVLKGDMSLVGPRPLLIEYLPLYTPEQARRHEVRPGITGWAQVNGRNELDWEQRFALDVWYVDHHSFWLDMKILWMTFCKVLKREGTSQQGQATMQKFRGRVERREHE